MERIISRIDKPSGVKRNIVQRLTMCFDVGKWICRSLKIMGKVRSYWIQRRVVTLLSWTQFIGMRLFSSITIETYAYCNRKCEFCPNNDNYPARDQGKMKEILFRKIVDQLGDVNYVGRISPHFYGEPLLDKRLSNLVAYARQQCPFASIVIMSNGDFLTKEMMDRLIHAGMDKIEVTNYDNDQKEHLSHLSREYGVYISIRNFDEVVKKNRGGLLKNVKEAVDNDAACGRPISQMVVNWKGQVVLCCNDYYGKHIFGNLEEDKIIDVWRSEKLHKFQVLLFQRGGRQKIDMCRECDG